MRAAGAAVLGVRGVSQKTRQKRMSSLHFFLLGMQALSPASTIRPGAALPARAASRVLCAPLIALPQFTRTRVIAAATGPEDDASSGSDGEQKLSGPPTLTGRPSREGAAGGGARNLNRPPPTPRMFAAREGQAGRGGGRKRGGERKSRWEQRRGAGGRAAASPGSANSPACRLVRRNKTAAGRT